MFRALLLRLGGFFLIAVAAPAEPLSRKLDIDFFRDVPSRNLKGLATRSDGRLVAGPALAEIPTTAPADLLWCLEPTDDPARFLVGTGADGRIFELTLNGQQSAFTAREVVKLDDPQVFTIKRLADGTLLVGTSPRGALYLVRDGKPVARVPLPVDSIFDLLPLDPETVLAATGNPARIYKIDVRKFAGVGLIADKITDAKILADRGITLFGEVRDRNVRRIIALPDHRIAAGSSPKGNIYTFAAEGGAPVILQENRDAEVTDLLAQPNGDLFASIVYAAGTSGEARITPASPRSKDEPPTPPPAQIEKFGGRSSLVWFPANGFAETLTSRNNVAFYRIVRYKDTLIAAGGEQGDLLGYDLDARLSLTFAGSISAQVNGIAPLASPGKFLLLRNNAPGLAVLDFNAAGGREAETRRLDFAVPSLLGALRFNRLRNMANRALGVEAKVSNGSDEVEGWGPWTPLQPGPDGGWRAANLRGRYAKLRIHVAQSGAGGATADGGSSPALEIDRATLFDLPQNRRPQLQDFRVLTPNFGLIVATDQPPPANVSLSSLMQGSSHDNDAGKNKGNFQNSQVVPVTGAQVVLWTVTDPDNDNFLVTFSIRREGEDTWTEIAANTLETYAQFDASHLPDGIYFTRLVATETAPRPPADRLAQTFETDDLIVDHTAPELLEATAKRSGDNVTVTVHGRDRLSLLDGVDLVFNNSVRETVEQPADGIRDGREEIFTLEIPRARISNATSVEVTLYDAAGNGTSRRLTW